MQMRSMTNAVMASCCISALLTTAASGQALEQTPAGDHLVPVRAAFLNEDFSMQSGWIDYQTAIAQRGGACAATSSLMYDCFQPDTDGISPIGGDTACGLATPDTRLNFPIETSPFMRTADDFTVEAGFEGGEITRITGALYWYGDGNPANSEQCFIAVQIWEDIDDCTGGPDAVSNFLGNVIVDLGLLQNNPGFYYTYDIDVCALLGDSGIQAPADGSGGVDLIFGQAFDAKLGEITLATSAQPMVWGTAANRPGSQSDQPYWRDVNGDFTLDPATECFDYTGAAACPDNIGTMIALFGTPGDPCFDITLGDVNNDTTVDLLDVAPFESLVNSPATPTQDQLCRADYNDDGRIDHFDQIGFITALTGGPPAERAPASHGPAPASDIGFFLAVDGLSDPMDFDSVAVDPVRENPQVAYTGGGATQRLYIWSLHNADNLNCNGLSFNIQTTGDLFVDDLVIYDAESGIGMNWGSIENGSPSAQGWENASAAGTVFDGLFTGFLQELGSGLDHPHVIDDLQLVGHIDYAGVGEIFLEVGHSGIIRDSGFRTLPGPDVALGFGDAPVSGSAYNTASAMADAVSICLGDLNGDSIVDTADLGILIAQFNTAGPGADINGDGVVDTADLGILIAQFGSVCFGT